MGNVNYKEVFEPFQMIIKLSYAKVTSLVSEYNQNELDFGFDKQTLATFLNIRLDEAESLCLAFDNKLYRIICATGFITGIIIYSKATFDQKVDLIFDLYNFNKGMSIGGSITKDELAILILVAANVLCKMTGRNTKPKEKHVTQYVETYFVSLQIENKITLSDFKFWASQFNSNEEISIGEVLLKQLGCWEKKKKTHQSSRTDSPE